MYRFEVNVIPKDQKELYLFEVINTKFDLLNGPISLYLSPSLIQHSTAAAVVLNRGAVKRPKGCRQILNFMLFSGIPYETYQNLASRVPQSGSLLM